MKKESELIRFQYSEVPLTQRNLEDLQTLIRILRIDRNRVLQVVFPGYDDPEEIRIAAQENGYYLGMGFPMDDFGWPHPLILAAEDLSVEEVEQVIQAICGEGKSTEEIPVVMEKLKDITKQVFGEK